MPFDISFLQLQEYREKYSDFIVSEPSLEDGSIDCDEEKLRIAVKEFRMCPSEWVAVERENRYPKTRMVAKCRCNKCVGGSTAEFPIPGSRCMPVHVLMPVLVRIDLNQEEFNWKFFLEPVPVTCVCGTTLDPVVDD